MIRNDTMDVLLKLGMPASIKGLTYICDAVEIFDTDPYYPEGKICSLYSKIASLHNTTATSVERAIRHAFETTLNRGEPTLIKKYLDLTNTQNSNLLRTLYYRMKQEHNETNCSGTCQLGQCLLMKPIDHDTISFFCEELAKALVTQMKVL